MRGEAVEPPGPTASIVIPAHDEARSIAGVVGSILAGAHPDEFEVVVVANGCTDATAATARAAGATVVELADAGKAAALDAGDRAVSTYPRVYLDGDIRTDAGTVRAVCGALTSGALAAVPARVLVTAGRPWPVRCYYAVQSRLPAAREGLYGRGLIALSREGRDRFATFPRLMADDLYLDSLFAPEEKRVVTSVSTVVETPLRTRDLVRRLARVRRGNAALREAAAEGAVDVAVRPSDRSAWWRDVVLRDPSLLPAGVVYVAITLVAAVVARRLPPDAWLRDESSRQSLGGRVG